MPTVLCTRWDNNEERAFRSNCTIELKAKFSISHLFSNLLTVAKNGFGEYMKNYAEMIDLLTLP